MRVKAYIAASQTRIGCGHAPDRRRIGKLYRSRSPDLGVLDTADDANAVQEERRSMKFDQNRAGQWNIETMLAALRVLAGRVHRGFFVEIGFAGQRKDSLGLFVNVSVGVNVHGDGLRTALLAGPAFDVRTAGVNGNAINVADDGTRVRFLTERHCRGQRKTKHARSEGRERR